MIVNQFLKVSDVPSGQIPDMYLGPYYSNSDARSFLFMLGGLANTINDKIADGVNVRVIRNIEIWAEVFCYTKKELLMLAIEKRSSFTFDIINWIETVADILMQISDFDVCDDTVTEKLQKHASWIICTLSWIPKDRDTVAFVESYKLTVTSLKQL